MVSARLITIFALIKLFVPLSVTIQPLQMPLNAALVPKYAPGIPANASANSVKVVCSHVLMADVNPNV